MSDAIRRTEVGGRPATVSYLTREFEPATPDEYDVVKIEYDDGEVTFAYPVPDENAGPRP